MTRRRATGTQRTTDGGGGDYLDQLLDDDAPDTEVDGDLDADGDAAGSDRDQDDDDAVDDDQDATGRNDDHDDRGGRRRKRGRSRGQDDAADVDDDRDRPITVEDLEKAAQRIADRQVNALLRRLDRGKSGGRDQQDGDDRGGRRRREDRDRHEDSDRDTSRRDDEQRSYDQREARLAFRDYFGGDGRSLSTTERELANTLGRVEIGNRLDEHGDPDRAGREAADRVGDQLAEFRRLVEKQTVAALRKRGALRERGSSRGDDEDTTDSGNAGGSQPPGRAPSPAKLADKRQAAKSFAADYNARLGHTPTPSDAGTKVG